MREALTASADTIVGNRIDTVDKLYFSYGDKVLRGPAQGGEVFSRVRTIGGSVFFPGL